MPKRIPQNELDVIIEAVAGFPEGAGIEKISTALENRLPRRTLQRRLALLVEQERITVEGRARAIRYRLPDITADGQTRQDSPATGYDKTYILLSPVEEAIRQTVCKPIQNRRPVGYNRDFLNPYHPSTGPANGDCFRLWGQNVNSVPLAPDDSLAKGLIARLPYNHSITRLPYNHSITAGYLLRGAEMVRRW